MIMLLKVDMTFNIERLYGFLTYMSVSSNTFIFSNDMIIHSILDVAAILGFSIIGLQLLQLLMPPSLPRDSIFQSPFPTRPHLCKIYIILSLQEMLQMQSTTPSSCCVSSTSFLVSIGYMVIVKQLPCFKSKRTQLWVLYFFSLWFLIHHYGSTKERYRHKAHQWTHLVPPISVEGSFVSKVWLSYCQRRSQLFFVGVCYNCEDEFYTSG